MAEFINTIETLGDDAVVDSIINRTITEFKDDSVTTIAPYALYYCTSLESVDMPALTTINGRGAFAYCTNLKTINFPSLKNMNGEGYVFERAVFAEAVFPKLVEVKGGTFQYCGNLTKLDFHALNVFRPAVGYCGNLTALIIRTPSVCTNYDSWSIQTSGIGKGIGYIYVPKSLIEEYKAATNWSNHADRFRALEDYTVDGTITGELDETKI